MSSVCKALPAYSDADRLCFLAAGYKISRPGACGQDHISRSGIMRISGGSKQIRGMFLKTRP
jgi:hypothetical protein